MYQRELDQKRAIREEEEIQKEYKSIWDRMEYGAQRMDIVHQELQEPKQFQPKERFLPWSKYAFIICN